MPEGHLIHAYARAQTKELCGDTLAVSSPQGRFTTGAQHLDGLVLRHVDAYGKHLLYDFGILLHVHLGMAGVWFRSVGPPRQSVRMRLAGSRAAWDLIAPNRCELYTDEQRRKLISRLGADPLRRDADPTAAFARLQRSPLPIGAALLDQRIIAGVGNVIRNELLYELGVDPQRPAASIDRESFDRLWTRLVAVMRASAAKRKIVFAGAPRGRRYVYKEDVCHRCASKIVRRDIGARTAYVCPTCQRS